MGEDHTEPDQQESTEPVEPTEAQQPASDEPPAEPARRSRAKLVAAVCLLVAGVAAAVYSGVRTMREQQRRQAALTPVAMPKPMAPPAPIGSEDAKLKIEVCLGHCVSAMFQPFAECAEAWPDRIRAEFYAYESEEGRKLVQAHGETLACVFFNGENRFTLEDGGERREVHFHGPPGNEYQIRDLGQVLRLKMKEAYGSLPPDFEEKVAVFSGEVLSQPVPEPAQAEN
jgi:hypothetical protein